MFDDTVFVDCPQLKSLRGLERVTKLGKDLVIRNLKSLTSTAGLGNLTSVGEYSGCTRHVCMHKRCIVQAA